MIDNVALTAEETRKLIQCETAIERGLDRFIEVGGALLTIRKRRLYRAEYDTFEAYCQERWGIGASRARQLIGAIKTVANLESVTIGNALPTTERQVRPLASLSPNQQREAWTRAVETAPDGKVTGAHVQAVVTQMLYGVQTRRQQGRVRRHARRAAKTTPTVHRCPGKQANDLDGTTWLRYSISVWDDVRKDAEELALDHPAIFPAMLAERLIRCFTIADEQIVLDPMAGSGSALVAAKRLGKVGIGVELCEEYAALAWERLERTDGGGQGVIHVGNAHDLLDFVEPCTVDLAITSPPYWDILSRQRTADGRPVLNYTQASGNVGHVADYGEFLQALQRIYGLVYHVLKPGAYFCVVVMDVRKRDRLYPLHYDLAQRMQELGFVYDDVIIWDRRQEYNNLRPLGYPCMFRVNRVHEYVLIFRKAARAGG